MSAILFGDKMKRYKHYQKVLICIFPFALALILFFAIRFVADNFTLPGCITNVVLGIYCPGCGMTRSVIALVHGDVFLSIRQNAFAVFAVILFAVFYIEFALRALGFNVRFPIHSEKLLYVILIIAGIYCVLRNFIPWLMPV